MDSGAHRTLGLSTKYGLIAKSLQSSWLLQSMRSSERVWASRSRVDCRHRRASRSSNVQTVQTEPTKWREKWNQGYLCSANCAMSRRWWDCLIPGVRCPFRRKETVPFQTCFLTKVVNFGHGRLNWCRSTSFHRMSNFASCRQRRHTLYIINRSPWKLG